jgi:two-component sensor histidine kinase
MIVVDTAKLSPKELFHSVNNQLAVVMAQAEMLAKEGNTEQTLERCREIKRAAANINRLLQAFVNEDKGLKVRSA